MIELFNNFHSFEPISPDFANVMAEGHRASSPTRVSPLRAKSSRFPWLLLFWWTQTTLWLRRWLKVWVQKPLMRLGIGSQDDVENVENEAMEDATPSTDTSGDQQLQDGALPCGLVNNGNLCFVNAVLQCLATVPGFLESVDRALRMRTQLHMVRQADDAQAQKLLVAETLVSLFRGISKEEEEMELELEAEAEADGARRRAEQHRHRHTRDDNQQKMRRFRSAASRCTYLVSSAASRQEQQDAEEFLSFLLELLHDLLRAPAQPERQEEERQHFLQSEKSFLKKLKSYDPNDPRSYMHAVGAWSLDMVKA